MPTVLFWGILFSRHRRAGEGNLIDKPAAVSTDRRGRDPDPVKTSHIIIMREIHWSISAVSERPERERSALSKPAKLWQERKKKCIHSFDCNQTNRLNLVTQKHQAGIMSYTSCWLSFTVFFPPQRDVKAAEQILSHQSRIWTDRKQHLNCPGHFARS